jgi:nucleoside-diphosphate-sugar epimerase
VKTIVLGEKSYISKNIGKKFPKFEILSINNFINLYEKEFKDKKINLIINSFYTASKLNNIKNYSDFVRKSSQELSCLLDIIAKKNINKIIYTSSSAIYGLDKNNLFFKNKSQRNLYASFKLANEEMLKNFSIQNNISLVIARVFNVFGENEYFSIVSKLINQKNNKETIKIFNNGESIRDFIHIDDLVKCYSIFLKRSISGIYDIGTGYGTKISNLIKSFNIKKNILLLKSKVEEVDISIANTKKIQDIINVEKFKSIENFLKKKFKQKSLITKYKYTDYRELGSNRDVVIYGCGFSGIKIASELMNSKLSNVRFFVDDDVNKIGKFISGIKVISFSQMKIVAHKHRIPNIIVAIPSLSEKKNAELLEKLSPYCVSIQSLPRKKYFKNKNVEVKDLEKILIEEILNRSIFSVNTKKLSNFRNKVILVTGGAGSIGSEICRQLLKAKPKRVLVLDHSELAIFKLNKELNDKKLKFILGDIKDQSFVSDLINEHRVNYIFHSAAYKHVKFLEENIISAIKNNVFGTYSILKAIKNTKINATFISTDKAVNPTNVLGISKRIAEILVQIIAKSDLYKNCKISIVRFGNVLGSDGSAIPTFIDQIKNNQEVTITDLKMKRYFMSIKEACSLVIKASQIKANNKIFVLKMGKQIKIIDIINKIFKLYKTDEQVLKIKKIGNFGNEKVSERLTSAKSINSSPVKRIFIANEIIPKDELFFNFIDNLNIAIKNNQIFNLKKLLKNFKW